MRYLSALGLLVVAFVAVADDFSACSVVAQEVHEVYPGQFVTAVVTIKGEPCYDADLEISLIAEGAEIYSYSARFKPHTAIPWESLVLEDAERFASSAVSARRFIRCADLEPAQDDPIYVIPTVPKGHYEEIRASDCRVFQHNTHYESGVSVLLPGGLQSTVKVNEYGV